MTIRIERKSKHKDAKAATLLENLKKAGFSVSAVDRVDNFTIDADLPEEKAQQVARMLVNPVVEEASIDKYLAPNLFEWAIEVGFLPGITDNVANTVAQQIKDRFKESVPVYTSQTFFISGVNADEAGKIAETLYNPQIQRVHIKSEKEFDGNGMGAIVPRVKLTGTPSADIVDILNISDEELAKIGDKGIANKDGTRRGPLSMRPEYMKTVQNYFRRIGKNPTDVELESIAQTWSEHCKHTIFADPIDDIKDGLFKHFIKRATDEIRKKKGDKDFCVSVFTDNSGVIKFDHEYVITHKVETHNSPSALDPFGGSITGIVGVNRDAMGCGKFAKPVINVYGFCFGNPDDKRPLYRKQDKSDKLLSPRRIMDGVIEGVNAGGNCSGIPTPQGFVYFDERYRGKPLVFVGTVGLMPALVNEKPSHEKGARDGDYIVMLGGRVGKDGIHGATFSSESLHAGSPVGAVQIGDPITQKKMSDALLEARDRELYNSITDNGAGGLSCSAAEMAKESGGAIVRLENVPTKYPNMQPWEIWISESQERMTLAVPKEKWGEFSELMQCRDVEASVIGQFTESRRCLVTNCDKVSKKESTVMDLDIDFLHDGLPKMQQETTYTRPAFRKPQHPPVDDLTDALHSMLSRQNIASTEFISMQYDHEVQGGSALKPLQGKGRINADATITRPVLSSRKGVVLSQGVNPSYSDLGAYEMAACAIDTAVRNAIVAGANPDHLALLDNFCWSSLKNPDGSMNAESLGNLRLACEACYKHALAYETPFISGKDSMFNDFKGFDENGNKIQISVPPTLLISSIGVIDDVSKAVSLDAKCAGHLVYVLGGTDDELGGSEYLSMLGQHGCGAVPFVEPITNWKRYHAFAKCIDEEIIASAQSVHRGGLAVALAKTAMGGMLGMEVSLDKTIGIHKILDSRSKDDLVLFSESMGRIVATVAPEYKTRFEELMQGNVFAEVGKITGDGNFVVNGVKGRKVINTNIGAMLDSYKSTFKDY